MFVNSVTSEPIYHSGNYTRDNVVSQAQADPVMRRAFMWEDLGIALDDLEGSAGQVG